MRVSRRQENQAAEEGCEKMKCSPCCPSGGVTLDCEILIEDIHVSVCIVHLCTECVLRTVQ